MQGHASPEDVGADAILRECGLSVCAYVCILYLCKILGRVTDAGEPVPVEYGARTGYSRKAFQESWGVWVYAEGLTVIKDYRESVLEKAGEQTGCSASPAQACLDHNLLHYPFSPIL